MPTTLKKSTVEFQDYGNYKFGIVDTLKPGGKILSLGSGYIWNFLRLTETINKDITILPSGNYIRFPGDPNMNVFECYEKDGTYIGQEDLNFLFGGFEGTEYFKKILWVISEDTNSIGWLMLLADTNNKDMQVGNIITPREDPQWLNPDRVLGFEADIYVPEYNYHELVMPFGLLEKDIQGKYREEADKPHPPKPPIPPPEPSGKTYSIRESTLKSITDTVRVRTMTSAPLSVPEGVNAAINTLVPLSLGITDAKEHQFVKIAAFDENGAPTRYESEYIYPKNQRMTETTASINPFIFYKWGVVENLEITCADYFTDLAQEYMFEFQSGTNPTTLMVHGVRWVTEPNIEPNKTYQVSILDNIGVIAGV